MPRRTMVEAIRDAMDVAMQRDENGAVVLIAPDKKIPNGGKLF